VNAVVGQLKAADSSTRLEAAGRRLGPHGRPEDAHQHQCGATNTLGAWQQTGCTGDGIRIGVIDDGIDYTHADFGGPGTPAAYQSVDRTKATPLFPTAKVASGTDLVGDDYDSAGNTGSPVPKPDPNPLACGEHGTHVAGTIGGFGVNGDGTTFTGDYSKLNSTTLNALKIGPGTAAKALLYAIKVFGCQGSTSVTAQALDWSLDPDGDGDFTDHLDVVNLSLGSDFGAPDDPDALFVRTLAANNVLPVISAGNGGDLYDIAGSPGNTPEALTVASSRDASILRDTAYVTAPANLAGPKGGRFSQNFTGFDTLDLAKPVVKLSSGNADVCKPYSSVDKAATAGKYAWGMGRQRFDSCLWFGGCGRITRRRRVSRECCFRPLWTISRRDRRQRDDSDVPVHRFRHRAAAFGAQRRNAAGAVEWQRPYVLQTYNKSIVDTRSPFTSRGVRGPAVKPDVSAPGDTISSAFRGSGNDRTVLSGTSMAAPHTSGITALVRQAHPDYSVEEVKAAVINTAGHDLHDAAGHTYAPQPAGSGRIDAKAALENQVLAYVVDDPGAVSVNFGTVESGGRVSLTKTIKIVNKGTKAAEYAVPYEASTSCPESSTSSTRTP
jgi:subtilisin family serine protease